MSYNDPGDEEMLEKMDDDLSHYRKELDNKRSCKITNANQALMNQYLTENTPMDQRPDWREYERRQREKSYRICNWCGNKLMEVTNDKHPECDVELGFVDKIRNILRMMSHNSHEIVALVKASGLIEEDKDVDI